ncbi:hypothetical protein BH11GEM2_BH11GEM2_39430 [soil metagenome]
MHLRERGCGDRHLIEGGEYRFDSPATFALDGEAYLLA